MSFVNRFADRLLAVIVPRTTAGACVPPDSWVQHCYCKNYVEWNKNCHYGCLGNAVCGTCYATSVSC